jgi:hypothetical protein
MDGVSRPTIYRGQKHAVSQPLRLNLVSVTWIAANAAIIAVR